MLIFPTRVEDMELNRRCIFLQKARAPTKGNPSPSEFPRSPFGGNSPHCIKTAVAVEQDYPRSLPPRILGRVLPLDRLLKTGQSDK